MTKPTDPYSRVYWKVRSDDRFAGVYTDDHHFATWVRLLIAAEAAWPEPADVPATARRASLRVLGEAGIIVLLDGGLFRLHGLDAERMRRQERAATAASARWMLAGPGSNADGMQTHPVSNADGMPRARPEQSIAEQSKAEQSNGDRVEDDPPWLTAWLSVKMRMPTVRQRDVIDAYVRVFDVTGPERASRLILGSPDDPLGALMADLRAFREQAKGEAIVQEQEAVARRKVQRRGFAKGSVEAEIAAMLYAKGEAG